MPLHYTICNCYRLYFTENQSCKQRKDFTVFLTLEIITQQSCKLQLGCSICKSFALYFSPLKEGSPYLHVPATDYFCVTVAFSYDPTCWRMYYLLWLNTCWCHSVALPPCEQCVLHELWRVWMLCTVVSVDQVPVVMIKHELIGGVMIWCSIGTWPQLLSLLSTV